MIVIDKKGIASFLIITFGLTYAIEGALVAAGFRFSAVPAISAQLIVAGVMWVPALATVITVKFITREGFGITNMRFGPWRPYVASALLMPLVFAAVYGLTWLLGLGRPDWQLTAFRQTMPAAGAPLEQLASLQTMLPVLLVVSIIVGPTINGIFGFGEEFGWRGYLLPRLMPLGKPRAFAVLGMVWGLWHAPLIAIGFNYPGYPVWGILWMMALMTAFGIYLNEMTLKYRSSILAGSIHGAFNGQAYGIWRLLFPTVNPLLGGMTGLVGIAVWLVIGWWLMRRHGPVTLPA